MLESVGVAEQAEPDRHVDDGEHHDHAAENADEREGEGAEIELEQASPLGLLIGDVQRREQRLGSGGGAPKGEQKADREAPAEGLT